MSIQAVAWALEQQDELPATVKLVLVAICNHANHIDGYCWLDTQTIADEAACVPRSVYRFVGALVRNGYIRKEKRRGADGKQRANDYWVLLNRPKAKWDWSAGLHDGEHEDGETGEEIATADASAESDTTTSCDGVTQTTVGELAEKSPGKPVEKPSESPRPGDIGVAARESLEPSKTKPKESLRHDFSGAPRGYRPLPAPAPQPLGAVVNEAKQIFVYEGTRAWEAWAAFKTRERGVRWTLSTTAIIDGKPRHGWWFPSLFPPKAEVAASPTSPTMTAADEKEFADTG